jgi:hypothetical protein
MLSTNSRTSSLDSGVFPLAVGTDDGQDSSRLPEAEPSPAEHTGLHSLLRGEEGEDLVQELIQEGADAIATAPWIWLRCPLGRFARRGIPLGQIWVRCWVVQRKWVAWGRRAVVWRRWFAATLCNWQFVTGGYLLHPYPTHCHLYRLVCNVLGSVHSRD